MPERNWTTKTLARQLAEYIRSTALLKDNTIMDLVNSLKSDIVTEEVGTDLDIWGDG